MKNSTTVIPGRTVELRRIGDNQLAAREDDGSLYVYDLPSDTITKIASDVRLFAAADDGSLIAAFGSRSLEILPLASQNQKDYTRFNIPEAGRVLGADWYQDRRHLFVRYPDRTAFLDLDDSSLQNFETVVPTAASRYDRLSNALYFISDGQLLKYAFPG